MKPKGTSIKWTYPPSFPKKNDICLCLLIYLMDDGGEKLCIDTLTYSCDDRFYDDEDNVFTPIAWCRLGEAVHL